MSQVLSVRSRVLALTLLGLAQPAIAGADPITFAVRASANVAITTFTGGNPPVESLEDHVDVPEIFDADDLNRIDASVTGSGASAGYSGTASAQIIDSVLGVYATATFAGSPNTGISSSSGAGFIDYFTVAFPEGNFVPMSFTLVPSYTIQNSGGCGQVSAGVQIGGAGTSLPGDSLSYLDSICGSDSLVTAKEFLVPTGVPFRVLYELSVAAFVPFGVTGATTIDALTSLHLLASPVGDFSYTTASGHDYTSTPGVPEPTIILLVGAGLATVAARSRKRSRQYSTHAVPLHNHE